MNRTKVTVACQACQKKKVKCTGVAPCTNCERTRNHCEFTGNAKKRGPRNGTVEVIKSPAKRIENALKKDPSLKGTFDDLLAKKNFCQPIRSARPASVTPTNASIVIIDDDTDTIQSMSAYTNAPRNYSNFSRQRNATINLNAYPRDDVSAEMHQGFGREFDTATTILRRPVPVYPPVMQRNHVTNGIYLSDTYQDSSHADIDTAHSLPPITSFESFPSPPKDHILPGNPSEFPRPHPGLGSLPTISSEHLTLPPPWTLPPKKPMSMPIFDSPSGMPILLPPAPDVGNPLNNRSKYITPRFDDSKNMTLKANMSNDYHLSQDIDFHTDKPFSAATTFPSPTLLSPKSNPPPKIEKSNNTLNNFNPPTPACSL
ncbi:1824_t:CDS:2, partial [Acaulospora morrowiae]